MSDLAIIKTSRREILIRNLRALYYKQVDLIILPHAMIVDFVDLMVGNSQSRKKKWMKPITHA